MDWLRIVMWAQLVSLVIALAAATVLVYNNLASKTLVLAASAFVGAVIVFGINLWTELQSGSPTRDRLSVEYVIDRAEPFIRTWRYPDHGGPERLLIETGASHWLADHNPAAFAGDEGRLTLDLAVFSLIGLLTRREFDWQLRETVFEGDVGGTFVQLARVSRPGECREVSANELTSALTAAGNVFAGAPVFVVGGAICLPPGGEVHVSPSAVALRTPICQVTFVLEPSGGVNYSVPRSGGKVEVLPDKSSRYETRVVGFAVEITRFALRAAHRDAEKQVAWCRRVVDSARRWFARAEPDPPEPARPSLRPGPVAPAPQ